MLSRTRSKYHPPPTSKANIPRHTKNPTLPVLLENNNEIILLNSKNPAAFERVLEEEELNDEEEKWRFRLSSECNFLRDISSKNTMDKTIRSASSLGRKKIVQANSVNHPVVLEEEVQDLADKLEELQNASTNHQHDQLSNRIRFHKKKLYISQQQRQLEHVGELSYRPCTNESPKLWKSSLSVNTRRDTEKDKALDMELLRKKMEGRVSNGILKRSVEEEYGSMLFTTSNTTPASTSKRFPEFSTRHLYQGQEENKCTGRCKGVVRRIVEQVRAETEQWSQMQEMVGQVRGEMEELQASRDFWESQAYSSENQIQSLRRSVKVWKEKALRYDMKANELQVELSALREEFLKSKEEMNHVRNKEAMLIPDMHWAPLRKQLQKEKLGLSCRFMENHHENWCEFQNSVQDMNIEETKEGTQAKDFPPLSLGRQLAEEKKTLLSHLQEDWNTSEGGGKQELVAKRRTKSFSISGILVTKKRSPLRDIENLSPLARQYGTAALPLHSPGSSRRIESFRK